MVKVKGWRWCCSFCQNLCATSFFEKSCPSLGPLIWSNWKDGDDGGFVDDDDDDGDDDDDDDDFDEPLLAIVT